VAGALGLVVVGAGVAGSLRARAARACPGFRLVGVADRDLPAARRAVRGSAALAVDDYRALLDRRDVDVVVVSAPTPLHEEVALAALGAGKHVLCEKPLAASSAACRRLLDAATRAGRILAVGFNHRYFPPFRFLARAVADGLVGRLTHVRARAGHDGVGNFRAEWMYVGALSGGGAMMDLGLHLTDLVRVLVGEVDAVQAVTAAGVWDVPGSEDDALVLMTSAAGVPVAYHATWTEWRGYTFRIDAYGDRGVVRAQYGPMLNEIVRRGPGRRRRTWRLYPAANLRDRVLGWQSTAWRTFAAELRDLARVIDGEKTGLADGLAGLRAVELAEAAYESARRGAPVRLPAQAGAEPVPAPLRARPAGARPEAPPT
jgi:predicted dehydrogenase